MNSFELWLDQQFQEKGFRIEEASLLADHSLDYWHSTILDRDTFPVAGGFASDRMQARKIAIAEFLERKTFREISQSDDEKKKWGLDLIPTACGFAAGFDRTNTILRALFEACERWVMSKWIDDGFYIEEIPSDKINLDPVSQFFAKKFIEVKFYKKKINVFFHGKIIEVEVAQTMGFTKEGIFPGSSAQVNDGSIWQHSLLESYRHLLAIQNNTVGFDKFPGDKALFFSKNKDIAISQIKNANQEKWPIPEVIFERIESKHHEQCYVGRVILKGWRSWHEGPLERFLY